MSKERSTEGAKAVTIVITGDDDRYASARRRAISLAGPRGDVLILYDWDAPTLFGDPLPTWWSGEGSEDLFSHRLDQTRLRAAGRATIADQVAEAEAAGVTAFAWLPSDHGPKALADYAREQGASTIVVPGALEEVKGLDVLLNGTDQPAQALDAETRATVIVADEEGGKDRRP